MFPFQKKHPFQANLKKAKIQSLSHRACSFLFPLVFILHRSIIIPTTYELKEQQICSGLFSISAKQLQHALTSFRVGFIQHFRKRTPTYSSQQCFPTLLCFWSCYSSLVKTAISFIKVERVIIALNSLHFLDDFSSFLKIYGTHLFPFLNYFQLPHQDVLYFIIRTDRECYLAQDQISFRQQKLCCQH